MLLHAVLQELQVIFVRWCTTSIVLYNMFIHSLEKKVRDIVHKAFWDCLEAQLKEDPPTYDHAIKLLGEIKEVR